MCFTKTCLYMKPEKKITKAPRKGSRRDNVNFTDEVIKEFCLFYFLSQNKKYQPSYIYGVLTFKCFQI